MNCPSGIIGGGMRSIVGTAQAKGWSIRQKKEKEKKKREKGKKNGE